MIPSDTHFDLCRATHALCVERPRSDAEIQEAVRIFTEAFDLAAASPEAARDVLPFAHHVHNQGHEWAAHVESIQALKQKAAALLDG